MKNVMKKIASAAMAFTLLGTGVAFTGTPVAKTVAPTAITASAYHSCTAHVSYTNTARYTGNRQEYRGGVKKQYEITERVYCCTCGKLVGKHTWLEWRWA